MTIVPSETGQSVDGRGSNARGQSYVLEAIGASVIVLAAVVFALQATAVTPLSVSTANQHIQTQERVTADTVLEHAARNGTLQGAVLHWNPDNRTFWDASAEGYLGRHPDNGFGQVLNRTFGRSNVATNVHVVSVGPSGTSNTQMIYQGIPSESAVTATHTLVLLDEDNLTAPGYEQHTLNESNATDSFYVRDTMTNHSVYTVVEVRLTVWRK